MEVRARPSSPFIMFGNPATYKTPLVSARVWWVASSLMATEITGYLDVGTARFVAQSLRDRLSQDGRRLIGYHDWTGVTDYDGNARIVLTEVARESFARSDGTHVLAPSPLVHFGLRTANFLLGNIYSYTSREQFESALGESLRKLGVR